MRHLASEIYHEIASSREWIKRPKIQLALVNNPAVPLAITLPLIKYLSMRELRNIVARPQPAGRRAVVGPQDSVREARLRVRRIAQAGRAACRSPFFRLC